MKRGRCCPVVLLHGAELYAGQQALLILLLLLLLLPLLPYLRVDDALQRPHNRLAHAIDLPDTTPCIWQAGMVRACFCSIQVLGLTMGHAGACGMLQAGTP